MRPFASRLAPTGFGSGRCPATKRHGAGFAAARHDGVASFLHENRYVQKTVTSNTHHPLAFELRNIIVKINWAEKLRQNVHQLAESLGNLFVETFHYLALFAIGAVTAWAAVMEFLGMLEVGHIKIDDILLLFIYLELGAMVGIYFKTNHMPVRFLIYIAITAVTRLIIDLVGTKHEADMGILLMGLTILVLALANALVRYASNKFPSRPDQHGGE